jgi:hypothetical protein
MQLIWLLLASPNEKARHRAISKKRAASGTHNDGGHVVRVLDIRVDVKIFRFHLELPGHLEEEALVHKGGHSLEGPLQVPRSEAPLVVGRRHLGTPDSEIGASIGHDVALAVRVRGQGLVSYKG